MSDQALDTKQASANKLTSDGRGNAPAPKAPMSMSAADHTQFVDLLLQEVAEIARTSASTAEPKDLLRIAAQAVVRTRKAIAAYTTRDTAPAPKQLFRTVDGAFMSLYELVLVLRDHKDAAVAQQATTVQAVLGELGERFEPAGWKAPKTDVEGHAREAAADKAGSRDLTTGEKGTLGRLHSRAARQHILGAWKQIVDGIVVPYAAVAAMELTEGMGLLIDPHLAGEANAVAAELEATEEVIARLFMVLEANNPIAVGGLQELAKITDSLRGLVKLAPRCGSSIEAACRYVHHRCCRWHRQRIECEPPRRAARAHAET
jgi:hypothetical protein